MRDEQYFALANLIKRPMRRWWARVGSWWLVGLGLLLVAHGALTANEIHLEAIGSYILPANQPHWYQYLTGFTWLLNTIAIVLAMLCVNQVISTIERATRETTAFSKSVLMVHTYRLAILNCWPALIPVQIWWVIFDFRMNYSIDGVYTCWLLVTGSTWWMLHYAIWIIWLAAIAVVASKIRWQMWLLFSGWMLPTSVEIFLTSAQLLPTGLYGLSSSLFPNYQFLDVSDIVRTALAGVGLLLVYGIPALYLRGHTRVANAVLVFISVALLGNGFYVGFGILVFDYIIQFGAPLDDGLILVRCLYSALSEPTLIGGFGGFGFRFSASPWFAIVPVIVNTIQLLVPYFALSWLMCNVKPPAPSNPNS